MMSPFVPLSHTVADAVADVRARNFRAGRDALRTAEQGGIRTARPCGISTSLRLVPSADESVPVHGGAFYEGRRPTGLVAPAPLALGSSAGDLFAALSHNAAASVLAYRQLLRELRSLGAPRGLRDRARRAASDADPAHPDRRHALRAVRYRARATDDHRALGSHARGAGERQCGRGLHPRDLECRARALAVGAGRRTDRADDDARSRPRPDPARTARVGHPPLGDDPSR